MKTNRNSIRLAASLSVAALIAAPTSFAAYSVSAGGTGTGLTAAQLVDILVPINSGISVVGGSANYGPDNPTHNATGTRIGSGLGDVENSAIGSFAGAVPAVNGLAFNAGVILSTGNIGGSGPTYEPDVTGSLPPNDSPRTSMNWFGGAAGSNLLDSVASVTSRDSSWLSFVFSSESSAFSFQYVFASDEYGTGLGDDGQNFNDAFAFVLTDLTTFSQVNLAVLPDNSVVSVQNVNQVTNSQFFTDNAYGSSTYALEYDGLVGGYGALPLYATANIVPDRLYRIDIVIGDTVDRQGDSAVFLAADSFVSDPPPNPVPEPATYVGALALGALIASRLRRK